MLTLIKNKSIKEQTMEIKIRMTTSKFKGKNNDITCQLGEINDRNINL